MSTNEMALVVQRNINVDHNLIMSQTPINKNKNTKQNKQTNKQKQGLCKILNVKNSIVIKALSILPKILDAIYSFDLICVVNHMHVFV